jgi:serine/threonine protein kinase
MGALRPGQLLDGTSYRVVREIGSGGMGVVYEIEHVRLKKRYVAKVIHDQIKNEDGAAKRMEREAQVLAAISHPNVVQVHDVGTTPDGTSYFVMEKLDGVDLRQTMKTHAVPRIRALEIVSDVLEALDYVHRQGVVHRDIKPENIFLAQQPQGTVTKILDFGIVHIFDRDGRISQGRITKTGGFVGTLYYAAPEQMQGKPAGPPNDVYAAALVLFELLAGKGPFDDDPGVGLSRCFKPAPSLTELAPTAPRELAEIMARALEQEPSNRPTAGALASDLRKVAATLKGRPGAVEDDAIRAEVDDLLRHMGPVDRPEPRPAAGRPPTVEHQPTPAPSPTPSADGSFAVAATAVPDTPPMGGGAHVSAVALPVEATMASAPDGPARGERAPTPALGLQAAAPVNTAMLDVAPVTAHFGSPQRISAPPMSPRFPGETAYGLGAPPMPMPMSPGHHIDSTPGAPAMSGDHSTSPGLYATIDQSSVISTRLPARTPWTAIVLGAAAVVLFGLLGAGWFAHRARTHATAAAAPSIATPAAPSTAPASAASAELSATAATAEPMPSASTSSAVARSSPPASTTKPTRPAPAVGAAKAPATASPPANVDHGYVKSL